MTRAAMARLDQDDDDETTAMVERLRAVEDRRQRLIDLFTDGDIERSDFRARRDALDDEAKQREARLATRTSGRMAEGLPGSYEELVVDWNDRGIDFQRRLIEALLHPIVVHPATSRKRAFDPTRVTIEPKA